MSVVAVSGDPLVVFGGGGNGPGHAGLLADVEVTKPFDLLLPVQLTRLLLKLAHELHLLIPGQVGLF